MPKMELAGQVGNDGQPAVYETWVRCPKCNAKYIQEQHKVCPGCPQKVKK